ncbi:Uncharacterized protein TPAR_01289 [Tolypocladium paradoxum]|uniref:RRM domain-containing protein n=1 Tax=Tolypocladium paradoxum TaxID=94208 RepID=A0A2S4L7V0_9HYPO|nr:Uncharacterized protein TPAR_01289 [Tolypocladium paradoxum]
MERPLAQRVKESALDPRAPCFHMASGTKTPDHCSDHATSVNEPPSSPESVDTVRPVPKSTNTHPENATWPSPEPIKPVEPKLNLLFHANYMRKLLTRQKRDLLHLGAATSNAAALVAESPHLPGAVAVLEQVMPTWVSSVEAAIELVGRLGEKASLLGRSKDAEGPSGAADAAATATAPTSSPDSHWRPSGAWDIAQTGDGDPFVDATTKTALGGPPPALALTYHPEIATLAWPRIYMPSSPDGTNPHLRSRRVFFGNLPPSTVLAQLLRGICCYGGIITASIVPDLGRYSNAGSRAAVVEFVYPDSAAQFAHSVDAKEIILRYAAEDGTVYDAQVSLVLTDSFFYTTLDHKLLESGATRALGLQSFPIGSVWRFLSVIGIRHITDVWYNEEQGDLVVEFTSLFQADRAQRNIERGGFDFYCPAGGPRLRYVSDSTQGARDRVLDGTSRASIVGHVPMDHLHRAWNRLPYNCHGSGQHRPVPLPRDEKQLTDSAPFPCAASPSPTEALAEALCIPPSEVSSYLAERNAFQDTEYRIVGSTIKLVRRAWSWSISAEDDTKLLMSSTISEPGWEDEWDRHFEAHGSINLRTWARYGRLARHRREKAIELGVEEWRVPRCEARCPWGCSDIKATPLPGVITEYLGGTRRDLLLSDDELEQYQ